ncbi:PorP/SprF family type IX secretion system membrane protein [Mariniradius sediminis]|uniref:Type IX secretion system membrane protein PorP/SprF n=1 Tax=Mariniradius sediminis TaxID=2909237 RepID=A0ABS9BNA7_9BACT|nr:type IX secretion system membrane protein PorP/SprF [Mariniradius sediminis]MCF1749546.1 type IX secretion system membrane protein PorP/SprF [Mariniradius sediminis]
MSKIHSFLSTGFWLLLATNFLAVLAHGQQDAQFTQYMYNGLYYNPAFAGKDGGYRFSALHRTQWLNYTGTNGPAPITQLLTGSARINDTKLGLGINFVNDNIAISTNQELNVSLAYHIRLRRGQLSFGASGGMYSSTIKFDELFSVNPDPKIPQTGSETQMNINYGAGIFFDKIKYYFALGSRHINQPVFDFAGGEVDNQLMNHSYLLAGYRIKTFAQWTFEPSVLVKSVSFNNFSYDLSVIATYNQKVSAGVAFRGEESVSMLLGYSILRDNSLRLGYAFDLVVSGQPAKAPTSHEFMLSYVLPDVTRDFQRTIQRTPRFRF